MHQTTTALLSPARPPFYSPISYGAHITRHNVPLQHHIPSIQHPLPTVLPFPRPGFRCVTQQRNEPYLHGVSNSDRRSLPGLSASRVLSQACTNSTQASNSRSGDWSCTICGNKTNFANRKACYRCNSPRQNNSPVTTTHANSTDIRQCPKGNQTAQMEHDRLLEQEKQFDSMFEKWEENFEQWKCDNENNTDWDYVQNHIDDMNKLKEKMLNRRKILIRRREQILG